MFNGKKNIKLKNNNGIAITLNNQKVITYSNVPNDVSLIYKIFTDWLTLCKDIQATGVARRKVNFPESISETCVAIVQKYDFLNQKSISSVLSTAKFSTSFDCFDPIKGDRIQVKASSTKLDLTSYGPRSKYDILIFADFYNNGNIDGTFVLYNIPINLVINAFVNLSTTAQQQAVAGKRPRMSMKKIINANNIVGTKHKLTPGKIL